MDEKIEFFTMMENPVGCGWKVGDNVYRQIFKINGANLSSREREKEWVRDREREREREREEDEEMQVSAHPSNLKLVLGLDRVGFGLG